MSAHPFRDDGSGKSCETCFLPVKHANHETPPPVPLAPLADPRRPEVDATPRHTPDQRATSSDAAFAVWPRTGSQRARVLDAIIEAGPRGLTDDEVGAALGLTGSSVRPRRGELAEAGWVVAAQDAQGAQVTRDSALGNAATVFVLSARGRAQLSRARTPAPAQQPALV